MTDSEQMSGITDPSPAQEQEKEETLQSGPEVQPQNRASFADSAVHTFENDGIVMTTIRATDVALGLRRLPAGFYVVVHYDDLEWRTENMPSSVNDDVVEWSCLIPMPTDRSAAIHLEVSASFEFQPMLGAGEQLRKLTTTVDQLLDRTARKLPFTFLPKDGDIVSPCSSILVTVERRRYGKDDALTSGYGYSTTESQGELEDATNRGHSALAHYRMHGERQDLERSVQQFELALNICPLDHPCLATAQSNLAMAKFILCQVEDMDATLDVSLRLYCDALAARPAGHLDRPSMLIHLALVHFAQFRKRGGHGMETQAEALLHEVMELSSTESHERRAAIFILQVFAGCRAGVAQPDGSVGENSTSSSTEQDLRNLSLRLLKRFQRFGDLASLQQAITVLEEQVRSTSVSNDLHRKGLGNLSTALSYRFERLGDLSDLEDAIAKNEGALELTPDGHPDKHALLCNLGSSFFTRFERLGQLSDLETAMSKHSAAVDLIPDDHPNKSALLSNLGSSFFTRFERLGQLSDLEGAISKHQDAHNLTPSGHPNKPSRLNNLGNCFFSRFKHLGQLTDLEDAISRYRDAIDLTPLNHPARPTRLNNLGTSLLTRFRRLGRLNDLDDAVSTLKDTVELTPHGHVDKPAYLSNLGNSFSTRFEHVGKLEDLEDAISKHRDAVNLIPHGHSDKPTCLNNLGTSLLTRFEHLGQLTDLEDAISKYRDAVDITPNDHPERPAILTNLGNSFKARFRRLGQLSDVEGAILKYRDAVNAIPHGHPAKPTYLTNLGNAFITRFEHIGRLNDLEDAMLMHRDAVDLTPEGHLNKPALLSSLGSSFFIRFQRLGQLSDLEDAISRQSEAVHLTPDDHPSQPKYLNNLGNAFFTRFAFLGKLTDLEGAILRQRKAVDLTSNDHTNKPNYLSNLGNSLRTRFQHLGKLSDLEDAISTLRDAVDLTPPGHVDKPARLNNLGNSFLTRFQRLRQFRDLSDAISVHTDAVALTPDGHPNKPAFLNSLGNSFLTRFERLGDLRDLEEAISRYRDAIELTADGHPYEPWHLDNLGKAFRARFLRLGQLSDLEGAILRHRDAVDLITDGHLDKPTCLTNLGLSVFDRFERLGDPSDLNDAISILRDAVHFTPHGHPDKPGHLNHLGNFIIARFERFGEPSDLEQAISIYSYAASDSIGPITDRFSASQNWISTARYNSHHSLLHAYSVAISLLPQIAWIGLALEDRYSQLLQSADVVREAAAAALDSGLPETAVEWLEQGRSIIWGELFQLRSSHLELSAAYPDHACRLQELSAALEDASSTHEKYASAILEQTRRAAKELFATAEHASSIDEKDLLLLAERLQSAARGEAESLKHLNQEGDRRRVLAIARDELLQEIRGSPGFEQFLLRKQFSQLRASAHSGPVVILNAAESRCDALCVLADVDHVIHVPLPNFTAKRSLGLRNTMKGFLRHVREGKTVTVDGVGWETFLSPLWKCVVKPVLDALALSTPGDLSRIFWCPTGPLAFLPIHAAGFYDTEYSQLGNKIFDFVISSYVPTLTILSPSPNPPVETSGDLRLLAVRQPLSDGESSLPGVATELEHLREVIRNSPSAQTILVESSAGTVEEVLSLMKDTEWVHFACHGIQDGIDSGLCLADRRRLKLRDIVALSRPRGGLAFLSACQTATGEESLSDEAIHIAAGMLFAGYKGVIGTMWSISDDLAPRVARDVYSELFRNGTRPDYLEAARAVHEAVGRLRDREVSFVDWIPFIHVGL